MPEEVNYPPDLKWVMLRAGWFPGREDCEDLNKLDFTLHESGQRIMREFGGLRFRNVCFEAEIANLDFPIYKQRFDEIGIPNALPLGSCDYITDGSIWMDDQGRFYQAARKEMFLAGQDTWEGLANLVMLKGIPAKYPRWQW